MRIEEIGLFIVAIIYIFVHTILICNIPPPPSSHHYGDYIMIAIFQLAIAILILAILGGTVLPVYERVFGKFGFTVYVFVSTAVILSVSDCHIDLCGMPSLLDILAQALCHVFFGSTPCPFMS